MPKKNKVLDEINETKTDFQLNIENLENTFADISLDPKSFFNSYSNPTIAITGLVGNVRKIANDQKYFENEPIVFSDHEVEMIELSKTFLSVIDEMRKNGEYVTSKELQPDKRAEAKFQVFKSALIEAKSRKDLEAAEAKYVTDDGNVFVKDTTVFHEMKTLLNSGDSFLRGSSSAYKSIQKDVKKLDEYLQANANRQNLPDVKRRLDVMTKALLNKVNKYIDSHKKVEMEFPVGSYESKRVFLMRQVKNRLTACQKNVENKKYYQYVNNMNLSEDYANSIKSRLNSHRFDPTVYAEHLSLVKNGASKELRINAVKQGNEAFLNSAAMKLMEKSFAGEKLSVERLDAFWNKACKVEEMAETINNYSKEELQACINKCNNNIKILNKKLSPLAFADNMIYEDKNDCGDYNKMKFDCERFKRIKEMSEAAITKFASVDKNSEAVKDEHKKENEFEVIITN